MASFHPSEPDGTHRCPHCGAHYRVVEWGRLLARDSDSGSWGCCGKEMARWNVTDYPKFELIEDCREAGDTQPH